MQAEGWEPVQKNQTRVTDVALGEQGWPDQVRDESGHVWNPHRRAKSQS